MLHEVVNGAAHLVQTANEWSSLPSACMAFHTQVVSSVAEPGDSNPVVILWSSLRSERFWTREDQLVKPYHDNREQFRGGYERLVETSNLC